MSKGNTRGLLLKASKFDADNLAIARQVAADPEAHIPALQDWARRVLARLGDASDRQQRLPLGDS